MINADTKKHAKLYYNLRLKHTEILQSLAHLNGTVISNRTLQRILHGCGLYKYNEYSNVLHVALYLFGLFKSISSVHGNKLLHLKCIQRGFIVKQETIRPLLHMLDQEGVTGRKRHKLRRCQYFNKRPNYCMHIDSYDKLKPYGICSIWNY